MSLADYRRDKKPLSLRAISVILIVTFLVTQTDVRLAFSYTAPTMSNVIPTPDKLGQKEKAEDVFYMQDLDEFFESSPLSKETQKSSEEIEKETPSEEMQQPPVYSAMLSVNPLSRKEGEMSFDEKDGLVKISYKNGSSYTVEKDTQKIREIRDFTDPEDENRLQTVTFDYSENENNQEIVRITTLSNDKARYFDNYQTYIQYSDGRIGNILESGIVVPDQEGDHLVREKIYDWDRKEVTFYDPKNAYYQAVYSMDENNKPYRLVTYQNRENDNPVFLMVRYDDQAGARTLYDVISGTFEEHKLVNRSEAGDLLKFGSFELGRAGGEIKIKSEIELVEIVRPQGRIPAYNFINPEKPNDVLVRERLEAGAPGRVLKILVFEGTERKVDQEYFYEHESETGKESITVFDYLAGSFIKMRLLEDRDQDGVLDSGAQFMSSGDIDVSGVQPKLTTKLEKVDDSIVIKDPGASRFYVIGDFIVESQEGNLVRLRGPPPSERSISELEFFTYEFNEQIQPQHYLSINLNTQTYSVYGIENQGPSKILEGGIFNIGEGGSIGGFQTQKTYDYLENNKVEIKDSKTGQKTIRDAPAKPSYLYSEPETRQFEYAYDLLSQSGIATATIVDQLDQEDLEALMSLDKEIGLLVLYGRIVLFTISDESELKILKSVAELAQNALLIVHTHPTQGIGVSELDVKMAGEKTEYVLTKNGVYAYNQAGIQIKGASSALLLDEIRKAVDGWPADAEDEIKVRADLNKFIQSMDLYDAAPKEQKVLFRAGDLTPEEEEAYSLAEADLEQRISVSRENINREAIDVEEPNKLYLVTISYRITDYIYEVDIEKDEATLIESREKRPDDERDMKVINYITGETYRYEYDDDNGLVRVVNETNNTFNTYYYNRNQNKMGDLIRSGYLDTEGNYVIDTIYDYSTAGVIAALSQTDNSFKTYEYNSTKKKIGKILSEGKVESNGDQAVEITYDYSIQGKVIVKSVKDLTYSIRDYNSGTNSLGKILESGSVGTSGDLNKESDYDYSSQEGTVAIVQIETGEYTRYNYDGTKNELGRAIDSGVRDQSGIYVSKNAYDYESVNGTVAIVKKDTGEYTRYQFSDEDNKVGKALEGGVRDANGVYTATTEYMYDDVAQTVAVVEKASGKYTKYRYDAEDNRIGRALEGGVRDASGVY
ncbi:MAG: hypothetical protein PHS88_05485, partial [Candidatus Omnitrophica bacterium]|nr:hypothetical protein [Candidatus Omnitrophota bacterium]